MYGPSNYNLSDGLNHTIRYSSYVDILPDDVEREIAFHYDTFNATSVWILRLKSGRFMLLTSEGEPWNEPIVLCVTYRLASDAIEGAPVEYHESLYLKAFPTVVKPVSKLRSLTVGQIIQDRKDKVVRVGHLRDCASILSQWVNIVQSEGYV